MKISIVTTCLNADKTIKQTIDSILNQKPLVQTLPGQSQCLKTPTSTFEIEYIITDAGSIDKTLSIIKSYGDKIKLIDAKGLNQSEGINLGLKNATGEIIAFLNADDVYEQGAFDIVVNAFCKNKDRKWLIGKCKIINENNKEIYKFMTKYKNFFLKRYSYFLLLSENFISQPAVFWKREIMDEFGYFDEHEHYVMDYEYWLRIGKKYKPIFIDKYLASFRRMQSTKSNTGFYKQFKDDKRVAIKYATKYKNYLAIFCKYLNYFKTIIIYSFIIK